MTPEEFKELKELAKPLVKYLNEHHDPHTLIIIDYSRVDIYQGKAGIPIEDYID